MTHKNRPVHVLTLECNHQVPGAPTSDRKKCRACGVMRRVVEVGDLLKEAGPDHRETRVIKRADGLTIRHIEGLPLKIWWCRLCWGATAPAFKFRAFSMDEVFAAWDIHKAGANHVGHVIDAERIAAIGEA